MKGIIKNYLGVDMFIVKIRAIEGGLVIELVAMENKIEIMKRKNDLRGIGVRIADDLRDRERQVQE